jgi:TonB family protein
MGAIKILILENSLGQKVRTFSTHDDVLNLVYINSTRRIEAHTSLDNLEFLNIDFQFIQKIKLDEIPLNGINLKNLGKIKLSSESHTESPIYELPVNDDEAELKIFLKKSSFAHLAILFLIVTTGWIWTKYFNKTDESALVTIVLPIEKPKLVNKKRLPTLKVSQNKIKPSRKIFKQKVVSKKINSHFKKEKPLKAFNVQRIGALAALGGLPSGHRSSEGLSSTSLKNIRSAGTARSGGGIGNSGRGGIKGYFPGNGLIAGSSGSGRKAQNAGGYGTKGANGGKAGYGKIAIVGGTSAVSLPLDDEATIEGGLDRDQIIAVINRHRGQIVYCYERGLQTQPHIGGRVAVNFIIGPNGRINRARVAQSSLASKYVENCIVSRMKTWQFPRPVGRVNVDVFYPFELMRVSSR